MPRKPPRLTRSGQPSRSDQKRAHDRKRAAEQPWRAWYWTARWRRLAKAQLIAEPVCAFCLKLDRVTAATVCDHVRPHRGDEALFWSGPFQSLCRACHDGAKQRQERGRARR